jgi:hypothetical protein
MSSPMHGSAVTTEVPWVRFAACEIQTAISTLEDAGAALVGLVSRADWQSDGLRALHGLLARVRDDTGAEVGQLTVRAWELGGGGAE